jgi:hypothetical protein
MTSVRGLLLLAAFAHCAAQTADAKNPLDWDKTIKDQADGSIDDYFQPLTCGKRQIIKGDWVTFAVNISVHESSETGDPGTMIESSHWIRPKSAGFDDASKRAPIPYGFQISTSTKGGNYRPGWTEALTGIPSCAGARRRIVIGPPLSEKMLLNIGAQNVLKSCSIQADVEIVSDPLYVESTITHSPKECGVKAASDGDKLAVHVIMAVDSDGSADQELVGKELMNTWTDETQNKQPMQFTTGEGQIPESLEEAMMGMCNAEKRTVILPLELAPQFPNVTALGTKFKAELQMMSIKKINNVFAKFDENDDMEITSDEIAVFSGGTEPEKLLGKWCSEMDKNGDGVVSWKEFDGPKGAGGGQQRALFKFKKATIPDMPITEEQLKGGPLAQGFEADDEPEFTEPAATGTGRDKDGNPSRGPDELPGSDDDIGDEL